MYITRDFKEHVIGKMYDLGYRDLKILSGSVSPIIVERTLSEFSELNLKVYIGMIAKDGISKWTHQTFKHLVQRYPSRLEIYYHTSLPGQHSNIYFWEKPLLLGLEERSFVGSAAFTLNGFDYQKETLVSYNRAEIEEVFKRLALVSCNDVHVETAVTIHNNVEPELVVNFEENQLNLLDIPVNANTNNEFTYIDIPLTINGRTETPPKSGINWGHNGRSGLRQPSRTGNEAYLSISQHVHRENTHFLPDEKEKLLVLTDDGEMFVCVVAQGKRKAIETPDSNSILGAYLRNRIGVSLGDFVELSDLNRYGRDSIRLIKIHEGLYLFDFSVELNLGNCEDRLLYIDDRGSEVISEEEDMQILGETVFIRVPELDIDVYSGWLCSWNEAEGEFLTDSDLIIIKRLGTDEILYDEAGSSLIVAISNYCRTISVLHNMEHLKTLECEIIE